MPAQNITISAQFQSSLVTGVDVYYAEQEDTDGAPDWFTFNQTTGTLGYGYTGNSDWDDEMSGFVLVSAGVWELTHDGSLLRITISGNTFTFLQRDLEGDDEGSWTAIWNASQSKYMTQHVTYINTITAYVLPTTSQLIVVQTYGTDDWVSTNDFTYANVSGNNIINNSPSWYFTVSGNTMTLALYGQTYTMPKKV